MYIYKCTEGLSTVLLYIPQGYIDLANNLTPDKVMIVTTLPEFNAEALRDTEEKVYKTEPWYGTRYAVEGQTTPICLSDILCVTAC